MKGVLTKVKPLHAPLIPPDGAVAQNIVVRGGQQLYKMVRRMARSVPMFKLNKEGVEERVYAKNPMTAEPLYAKRKHEMYDEEQLFTLESQGNGNVEKIPYKFPTPEEIAAEEREKKIAAMGGGTLGAALVDMNVTPEELIARLMGPGPSPSPIAEPETVPGEELPVFPHPIEGKTNRWLLSNGEAMKGTKVEAIDAEAALHESVPEV